MRRHAFTVVDLLVIVAILSLLAAVVSGVVVRTRAVSKKSAAMAHLEQAAQSLSLYIADQDERLPFRWTEGPRWKGYDRTPRSGTYAPLPDQLAPYAESTEVWFSPGDRLRNKGRTSFAQNGQLAYAWSLSQIPRPGEAIYLTDRTDVDTFDGKAPTETYLWWRFQERPLAGHRELPGTPSPGLVAAEISPTRYTGNVATYLFLDTHVQAMPFGRTWGDAESNLHHALKI